jgi:rubredoxin
METLLFVGFICWLVYEMRKPNPTRGKSGETDSDKK